MHGLRVGGAVGDGGAGHGVGDAVTATVDGGGAPPACPLVFVFGDGEGQPSSGATARPINTTHNNLRVQYISWSPSRLDAIVSLPETAGDEFALWTGSSISEKD